MAPSLGLPYVGNVSEVDASEVLDDEAWERRRRFWRELVDEILASISGANDWPSWEPKVYGDGTTPMEHEYRSICEGRSWSLDRAFSIHERPPAGADTAITAWVKDHLAGMTDFTDISDLDDAVRWFEETPASERVPRSTLVLSLEESEAADDAARTLLEVWLQPATTVDEMETVISRTLGVLR
jgi:hypothetical protein